ncbi:transmembrane protein 68 [Galendromus occidentalis]|uniref:Acyltransferase n=1 Tax=Galendromus occidentalis TaxID=34638 RepID=A0AAJ6QSZ9_9ACAR|nr:transmembrane protein 68 [Galendromus occidentalis]
MVTVERGLRILSYAYFAYFMAIQPWLCWWLWDWIFLRPFILYIASLYPIMFNTGAFALCTAVYVFFEKSFGNEYRKLFARSIHWAYLLHGKLAFGYEVHGGERLRTKNALIVYYHGVLPVDASLLHSYAYVKYRRHLSGIVDRSLFQIPLIASVMDFFGQHCSPERLTRTLKSGGIAFVAPGGAYEALMSQDGKLEWRNRCGFARIAKKTGAAVIPMFTVNIQHFMTLHKFGNQGNELLKRWYLLSRVPLAIPKLVLPVKLRTYLGEPMFCGENETPEAFAARVRSAIELLRDTHQRQPPSVLAALLERCGIRW